MTARRSRTTAICNSLVKAYDDRPTANRKSRDQWVLETVVRIVGTKAQRGFVAADDAVSDILLKLLDAGGFSWEEDEILHFCWSQTSHLVDKYRSRRERSECEFVGPNGEQVPILELHRAKPANQETCCEASFALERLSRIPTQHRLAIEVLCDGGNPIDVAVELGIEPWAAIALIREGRLYVDRV